VRLWQSSDAVLDSVSILRAAGVALRLSVVSGADDVFPRDHATCVQWVFFFSRSSRVLKCRVSQRASGEERTSRCRLLRQSLALGVTAYLIESTCGRGSSSSTSWRQGRLSPTLHGWIHGAVRSGAHLYDFDAQLYFSAPGRGSGDVPLPFIRPAFELVICPLVVPALPAAYFTFLLINIAVLAICFRLLRAASIISP